MYTYAFLPSPARALVLPEGIERSLQLVHGDGLAALVETDLAIEELQQNDKQLMRAVVAHDRVIRDIFQQTVLLPLRFGTCFVSRQGLLEHLEVHKAEYLEKLAGLQGKAEYLLKLVPIAPFDQVVSPDMRGKDYFLAKKQLYQAQVEQQQQQQAERQWIIEAIAQTYPRWVQSEPNSDIERIYLLTDRQHEATLSDHLRTWQGHCSHWDLSVSEPLPPYHFV
jgi:hypothetical protein